VHEIEFVLTIDSRQLFATRRNETKYRELSRRQAIEVGIISEAESNSGDKLKGEEG
jgi:hypothetical protein